MELPAASWVNLALQIPLALVIVVLVIYFLRYLEKMADSVLRFLDNQANVNREFLKVQQDAHNASIARLAEEIKSANIERLRESTASRAEILREVSELTKRVDGVIDKAIMLERLLPDDKKK